MVLLLDRKKTRDRIDVQRGLAAMESAFQETVENSTANGLRQRHYAYNEDGLSTTRANVFSGLSSERGYAGVRARIDTVDGDRLAKADVIDNPDTFDPMDKGPGTKPKGAYLLFDVDTTELVSIQYENPAEDPLPSERFENAGANRTALNTTLGVARLARPDAARLGFLGSGRFAPAHVAALGEALPQLDAISVYSPTREHRETFARRADDQLEQDVTAVASAQAAVEPVDIVVACTNSPDPVFDGDWLSPGTTVASLVGMEKHVGYRDEHFTATEVDDTTLKRADVVACNSIEQAIQDEQGVLWERVQRGILKWDEVRELGELVSDDEPRSESSAITYFHNNGGQGIADLAVAIEHYEVAKAENLGTTIAL